MRVSGDPSRPLPEPILGPSSAPNPPKMAVGDFHDQKVKVWVQGAFRSVFSVVPSPDFVFFDGGGSAWPGAVAWLQLGEADTGQKHP